MYLIYNRPVNKGGVMVDLIQITPPLKYLRPSRARAHEGPGGPIRAQPIRARPIKAQGAHKGPAQMGPAHKGPGGAIRAHPKRAQGGPQAPGPEAHKRPAHKGPAHKSPGGCCQYKVSVLS